MRASHFLIATKKETPSDAEVISHKLMLRAGMIRKLASGLYNWLPLGLRVLRKVESIIREEMDTSGAQEVLMPVVQPSELWQESRRWGEYGPELLRLKDRHMRDFCLGPTHEEVITDLIRNEIHSYRQLPANFYQIQTKFRDEVRPRFGVMRSREFIMKDAYSFHLSKASLQTTYEVMRRTYCNIFDRIGLEYRAVLADTGSIGGSASHEFHVLADSGEDDIAFSTKSDFAANVELAEAIAPQRETEELRSIRQVPTPRQKTIDEIVDFLQVSPHKTVKTLVVLGAAREGGTPPLVALIIRGDHTLNEVKASKIEALQAPLTFADEKTIQKTLGAEVGSLGPVNLPIPTIVDRAAAALINFVCGANKTDFHFIDANWGENARCDTIEDIRKVVPGDPSPCGKGSLEIKRGIEVGHIFQLGTKYSAAMKAGVLDENGKEQTMTMGCYGIGVTRIVAAAIEQNHDDRGIIWPSGIAPFQVALIPINMHKSTAVKTECESLYAELVKQGIEVLFMDEAKARLGVMLADIELMGIPHRIVVGDRGLGNGTVEYQGRRDTASRHLGRNDIIDFIKQKLH